MCAVSVSATLASARLPLILVSCAGRVRNSRTPSRLKSIIVYKSGLIDPAGVRSSRHVMRSGLFTPRFPCSWACRRHRAQSPRAEPKRRRSIRLAQQVSEFVGVSCIGRRYASARPRSATAGRSPTPDGYVAYGIRRAIGGAWHGGDIGTDSHSRGNNAAKKRGDIARNY